MTTIQKLKQKFWRAIYPTFKKAEHLFLPFHEKRRQPYHIGWLHPNKTLPQLKRHLSSRWGFGNHFIAWEDTGQVLSWRKLESFEEQYHLRVFSDGEIRGHYEYTPEYDPVRHFFAYQFQFMPKRHNFLQYLEGYIVFQKYPREVFPDKTVRDSDSEITFLDSQKKAIK